MKTNQTTNQSQEENKFPVCPSCHGQAYVYPDTNARIAAEYQFCRGVATEFLNGHHLKGMMEVTDSLRSQLSAAKAKADWVDKYGSQLLKNRHFRTYGPNELRAILSSDEKAKEG